jgi:hypothetical protein
MPFRTRAVPISTTFATRPFKIRHQFSSESATRSQPVEAQHPRAIGLGVIVRLGVAAVLQIL